VGTGFHPELTGRENIFLNGAILGMTKKEIKSKFDEIVDFAGVERYIDTPVKRYSSGMYVRLAFGVAAHLEPEILIVDEVLAVGDAEFQKKALGKMKDVSGKDGRTVLFVSHNMAAVDSLCSKVIVLQSGNKGFEGNTDLGLKFYSTLTKKIIGKQTFGLNNNKIELKSIRLLNENSEPVHTILSGDYSIIELTYRNLSGNKISAAIGVYDFLDNPLFLCNSSIKNQFFENSGENIVVKLIIEKMPLLEGTYYCNIELQTSDGNRAYYKHAYSFNVESGDFHGHGVLSNWKRGFLIDFKWV
jgi:lipopolysaccharide transport system ATP-binding protein